MRPLKVSEVNNYIKKIFATDMILSDIQVEGEISNYNHHYSGHRYFSLKDNSGKIKCVMFKGYGQSMDLDLTEGQKIVAKGYISIYEKTGEYQLYVKSVEDQGVGALYQKYEKLKKDLEKEGLFKEEYKKELPKMPKKIGIVTSATGAAIEDMINVINRRFPSTHILIYPSLVQGDSAAKNIIKGIKNLDARHDVDLIIIGRGGGSIDELFAFNDEELARTIFNAKTPLISAVGHETDFTISDFVADLRAPTPSAAAELAVPNILDLKKNLINKNRQLVNSYNNFMKMEKNKLLSLGKSLEFNSPLFKIRDRRQELDMIFKDLIHNINDCLNIENTRIQGMDKSLVYGIKEIINNENSKMIKLDSRLQLLNPKIGLDKGHGILMDSNNKLIRSIKDINIKDEFNILLKDGDIKAVAMDIKEEDNHE